MSEAFLIVLRRFLDDLITRVGVCAAQLLCVSPSRKSPCVRSRVNWRDRSTRTSVSGPLRYQRTIITFEELFWGAPAVPVFWFPRWGGECCFAASQMKPAHSPPLPGSRTSPKSYEGGGERGLGEKGGTSVCLEGINMRGGGKKIKKGDRKRQPTFSLLESVLGEKKGENK